MTASAERLMEAEALPREARGEAAGVPAQRVAEFSGLELRGVSCRYAPICGDGEVAGEGRLIRCPDVTIARGEFVAFTGPSGCGKSTTLKAMMAFCPCETGKCCVVLQDGTREALTAQWRSLFAYVPQGNHLMSGTIRDAVVFGGEQGAACDERVWDALHAASADFVTALPEGLDTRLGESGTGLSEGQIQRLAIARALFADRPVLLLDEATCSLDPETEQRVLENLRALPNQTVIAVTHRPAALEVCDRQIRFGE